VSAGSRTAIVGVGHSDYSRREPRPVKQIIVEAALAAIADAGLEVADIDGIVSEASMMPMMAPVDSVAAHLGMAERPYSAYSMIGGAGNVWAAKMADTAIRAGLASTVLVYFGQTYGSDPGGPYSFHKEDPFRAGVEMPVGWYGPPIYFAGMAQRYKHDYGLAPEQLGAVAVAAREHARLTPGAVRQQEMTIESYLASPMIADPLRLFDCCLNIDGAAAFVVTALERARDLRHPPAVIAGAAAATSPKAMTSYYTQADPYITTPASRSGPAALADAGLGVEDVDFAEVYDCFTISTILQLEDVGFCGKGEGAAFVEGGRIGPGGALPVNTHGGLLSHSYVVGTHHIVEAVEQLRGTRGAAQVPRAEVGLVAGLGYPDHSTLVMTRDR